MNVDVGTDKANGLERACRVGRRTGQIAGDDFHVCAERDSLAQLSERRIRILRTEQRMREDDALHAALSCLADDHQRFVGSDMTGGKRQVVLRDQREHFAHFGSSWPSRETRTKGRCSLL